MKKTNELKKEIDYLKVNISNLITSFIAKNGACGVSIGCQPSYIEKLGESKKLISSNVHVEITI